MRPIQTVGIIGLGALGAMYADLFTQALGRERVLVLADRGRIGALPPGGDSGATAGFGTSAMWTPRSGRSRWTCCCSP